MSSQPGTSLADLADGILVINLDARPDRWQKTQAITASIIPASRLQRLSAVSGQALPGFNARPWFRGRKRDRTWAGRAGCVLSHRKAIELAKQQQWKSVLILEDDLELTSQLPDFLTNHLQALKQADWDICYLGFTNPVSPFRKICALGKHTLHEVNGASTTHAYLLRDSTYDWLLRKLPQQATIWSWISQHRAIDRWYYRHLASHFKVYAVSPSLINQDGGFSDITQRKHEVLHTTSVPDKDSAAGLFAMLSLLRQLSWRLAGPKDWLRGQVKRQRGF